MAFPNELDRQRTAALQAQLALLEEQLLTAQAMLEEEARARIALEEKLMQKAATP